MLPRAQSFFNDFFQNKQTPQCPVAGQYEKSGLPDPLYLQNLGLPGLVLPIHGLANLAPDVPNSLIRGV
jgi:hypothetical protein